MSKRVKANRTAINKESVYEISEAIKTLKGATSAKFDETVELSFNLGLDPRHADQMLRGMISLPHGTGKTARVVVFAKGEKVEEATKAGADMVGLEDLVKKIEGGWFEFDYAVASPDCMATVGKIGKVLGPKGLMPNPKLGTVTPNVGKAVADLKAGMLEYKTEKNGIIHISVGKKSFDDKKLQENIQTVFDLIKGSKPASLKANYMNKLTLSSSMGPGIPVDMASLNG
jgi:large subunit ribosomal protein L1